MDDHTPGGPGQPVHYSTAAAESAGGAVVHTVHDDREGSGLVEFVLSVPPGGTGRRVADVDRDELLFVLSGVGTLTLDDVKHRLQAGAALHVQGGGEYALANSGGESLEVVCVAGPRDSTAGSGGRGCVAVDGLVGPREDAVSNREFTVMFDHASGCSGMTQFLGYVPQVRTPRHIHPYSEMICVVAGSGTVEIAGRSTRVGPGSCYYLPKGVPHLVENTGEEFLVELGVFTPSLSPAQNTPVA